MSDLLIVKGHTIIVMEKLMGKDQFRFFIKDKEFPFLSIDRALSENGRWVVRSLGKTKEFELMDYRKIAKWGLKISGIKERR